MRRAVSFIIAVWLTASGAFCGLYYLLFAAEWKGWMLLGAGFVSHRRHHFVLLMFPGERAMKRARHPSGYAPGGDKDPYKPVSGMSAAPKRPAAAIRISGTLRRHRSFSLRPPRVTFMTSVDARSEAMLPGR